MTGLWHCVGLSEAPVEIVDGDRGKNYPKKHEFVGGGNCLFLNAGNVTADGFNFSTCFFVSLDVDQRLGKGKLIRNDVVLTTRGTVGNSAHFSHAVPHEHVRINSGMVILRAYETELHHRFLYFVSRSQYFQLQIQALSTGSAQPQLPIRDIEKIDIPIPPLSEQRDIAHILGTIDDKIELNRRMNETLEEMARALFKSWFVDFDPVRAKAALTNPTAGGSGWTAERARAYLDSMDKNIVDLFPDRLVDSELGEIPEGWEVKALPDVVDFKEGPGIRNWQYTNSEEGTRFINIRCIKDGDIHLNGSNRIADEEANGKYAHFQLKESDIVVSTSGTLGRSAVVRAAHLPLVLNTSVIRFRPVGSATIVSFLYGYLNSRIFLDELELLASGSVQKNFGPMHLRRMRILCPPYNFLQVHSGIAGPLLQQLIANRTENDILIAKRDSLLRKLMSGEVRI